MARKLGTLIVDIRAQTAKFEQGLDKAKRKLGGFNKSISVVTKAFGGFAFGGTAAVASLALFANRLVTSSDQLNKLKDRLGTSTEAMSEMRFVAEKSGVRFETLTMGMQRMTRRVSEAASGFGEARGALAELNLDAEQLEKQRPEDQFRTIADALDNVETQADKVRLAMKLFDSEGVALVQVMKGGAAAIDEAREKARDFGLTISQDMADKMTKAADTSKELSAAVEGLGIQLAEGFVGDITEFKQAIIDDAIPAMRTFLEWVGLINEKAAKVRLAEIAGELKALRDSAALFEERLAKADDSFISMALLGGQQGYDRVKAQLADLNAQMEVLRQKRQQIAAENAEGLPGLPDSGSGSSGGAGSASISTSEQTLLDGYGLYLTTRMDALRMAQEEEALLTNEHMLALQSAQDIAVGQRIALAEEEAGKLKKIEESVAEFQMQARDRVLSHGLGLLRALGRESELFAKAALVLEKSKAIADVKILTQVAAARALAELGPIAGAAAAAQIEAAGAISIGLIAATGLVQASQIGGGGAGLGAPGGEPVVTDPVTDPVSGGGGSASQVQIHIRGNVLSRDFIVDEVIPEIRDAVNNRDVVIIESESRQHAELVGTQT